MLHHFIEGERVGDDGGEVDGVDRHHDDGHGGIPAPSGERGEIPPPSSFSLASPDMGGEFPLWSIDSMVAEGRDPLRDWIFLSVLFYFAFLFSSPSLFLKFPVIRNSDWAESLT